MSIRNWYGNLTLALVALAALVFMAGSISALLKAQYAKVHEINAVYQQNSEHNRHETGETIAQTCGDRLGSALQSCIVDGLESYYRQQATNEDLQAQQDMAFWAAAIFFSSTALTSIGIALLWLTLDATRKTLGEATKTTEAAVRGAEAAQATVDVTREIGEAQVRSYLTFNKVEIEIEETPIVYFTIENSGNSPARDVQVSIAAAHALDKRAVISPNAAREGTQMGTIQHGAPATGRLNAVGIRFSKEQLATLGRYALMIEVEMSIGFIDVFSRVVTDTRNFLYFHRGSRQGHTYAMAPIHEFRLDEELLARRQSRVGDE